LACACQRILDELLRDRRRALARAAAADVVDERARDAFRSTPLLV